MSGKLNRCKEYRQFLWYKSTVTVWLLPSQIFLHLTSMLSPHHSHRDGRNGHPDSRTWLQLWTSRTLQERRLCFCIMPGRMCTKYMTLCLFPQQNLNQPRPQSRHRQRHPWLKTHIRKPKQPRVNTPCPKRTWITKRTCSARHDKTQGKRWTCFSLDYANLLRLVTSLVSIARSKPRSCWNACQPGYDARHCETPRSLSMPS